MPISIKNQEVESLLNEIIAITGEGKTEAIKRALQERKNRMGLQCSENKEKQLLSFLKTEVWPQIPEHLLGKGISQEEQDKMLGFEQTKG